MAEIKKIHVVDSARTIALIYLVFGLAVSAIMAILGLVAGKSLIQALSIMALFSVVYAGVAFAGFAILASAYNFVAERWGGIKIDIK